MAGPSEASCLIALIRTLNWIYNKLACMKPLCCHLIISHYFYLDPVPASPPPPTRGAVHCSVFGRRNREAAFSINIPVFSVLGWIELVGPPM